MTQVDTEGAIWTFDTDIVEVAGDDPDLQIRGTPPDSSLVTGARTIRIDYSVNTDPGSPWTDAFYTPGQITFAGGADLLPGQTGVVT